MGARALWIFDGTFSEGLLASIEIMTPEHSGLSHSVAMCKDIVPIIFPA